MTTTTAPTGAQAPPHKPTSEQLLAVAARVALDYEAPDLRELVADAVELAAMTKRIVKRYRLADAAMLRAMNAMGLTEQVQEETWVPLGEVIGISYIDRLMMASAKAITDEVGLMNRPVTFASAEKHRACADFYAELVELIESVESGSDIVEAVEGLPEDGAS